jgi:hypothetical protein
MRDFTQKAYRKLLETALQCDYRLMAYEDFVRATQDNQRAYILRHDVDDLPYRSVQTATIEKSLGVRGTYYFRIVKQSNQPEAIKAIAAMGHEIGYHYEDLTLCKGNFEEAIDQYHKNLTWFRKFYPVSTICMHGSPMSRWDNRTLWERYNYKENGIIAEPYFDTDFSKVLYLTDTGRSWNGSSYSVRDKVSGLQASIKSTFDLMDQLKAGMLSSQIMQNIHPQRWTDEKAGWVKELLLQNIKNSVKRILAK